MRLLLFLGFILFSANLFSANWPAWRGPHGDGVCDETTLPTHWGTNQNVKWRTPLPDRGNSTPVVWGDRVFLTQAVDVKRNSKSSEPHRRALMCFDRETGKLLWESGVDVTEKEPTHDTNPYGAASPVTDGERIIVSYGAAGLYAYIAGSPYVFMELFHVNEKQYGWIFALVAMGLIGASQLNSVLLKNYESGQIVKVALLCQTITGLLLFTGTATGFLELFSTIFFIFIFRQNI